MNQKIVINTCFGGFGLSKEAMLKLHELGCEHIRKVPINEYFGPHWTEEERFNYLSNMPVKDDKILLDIHKVGDRACLILVQVVKELGEEASDALAKLKIVEIPYGVKWEIEAYDGWEYVAEEHRTWR